MLFSSQSYHLTVIFSCNEKKTGRMWAELKIIRASICGVWILGGDFNNILNSQERKEAVPAHPRKSSFFEDCVNTVGVVDNPYTRFQFTWTNNGQGVEKKCSKIDRVMVNDDWFKTFLAISVTSAPLRFLTIVLASSSGITFTPKPQPFRFCNAWKFHSMLVWSA